MKAFFSYNKYINDLVKWWFRYITGLAVDIDLSIALPLTWYYLGSLKKWPTISFFE